MSIRHQTPRLSSACLVLSLLLGSDGHGWERHARRQRVHVADGAQAERGRHDGGGARIVQGAAARLPRWALGHTHRACLVSGAWWRTRPARRAAAASTSRLCIRLNGVHASTAGRRARAPRALARSRPRTDAPRVAPPSTHKRARARRRRLRPTVLQVFDTDANGLISAEELTSIMKEHGDRLSDDEIAVLIRECDGCVRSLALVASGLPAACRSRAFVPPGVRWRRALALRHRARGAAVRARGARAISQAPASERERSRATR